MKRKALTSLSNGFLFYGYFLSLSMPLFEIKVDVKSIGPFAFAMTLMVSGAVFI